MVARKPPNRRQRTSTPDLGLAVVPPSTRTPSPDSSWSGEVAAAWDELWSSPLAGHVRPTDLPALRRLFTLRHQLARAVDAFNESPTAVGSTGQPVLSPWAAEVHRLEAAVRNLEDRFGLTPMARLRLGVTFEEGVSLAQRNAELLASFRERGEAS